LLFHLFLKTEHAVEVFTFIIVFFDGLWIMWVGMMTVEKLDNMEHAFADIEVDVPCFKIWGTGLPDNGIRQQDVALCFLLFVFLPLFVFFITTSKKYLS